jgi:hypothetical protein
MVPSSRVSQLLSSSSIAALIACGGGVSGNKPPPSPTPVDLGPSTRLVVYATEPDAEHRVPGAIVAVDGRSWVADALGEVRVPLDVGGRRATVSGPVDGTIVTGSRVITLARTATAITEVQLPLGCALYGDASGVRGPCGLLGALEVEGGLLDASGRPYVGPVRYDVVAAPMDFGGALAWFDDPDYAARARAFVQIAPRDPLTNAPLSAAGEGLALTLGEFRYPGDTNDDVLEPIPTRGALSPRAGAGVVRPYASYAVVQAAPPRGEPLGCLVLDGLALGQPGVTCTADADCAPTPNTCQQGLCRAPAVEAILESEALAGGQMRTAPYRWRQIVRAGDCLPVPARTRVVLTLRYVDALANALRGTPLYRTRSVHLVPDVSACGGMCTRISPTLSPQRTGCLEGEFLRPGPSGEQIMLERIGGVVRVFGEGPVGRELRTVFVPPAGCQRSICVEVPLEGVDDNPLVLRDDLGFETSVVATPVATAQCAAPLAGDHPLCAAGTDCAQVGTVGRCTALETCARVELFWSAIPDAACPVTRPLRLLLRASKSEGDVRAYRFSAYRRFAPPGTTTSTSPATVELFETRLTQETSVCVPRALYEVTVAGVGTPYARSRSDTKLADLRGDVAWVDIPAATYRLGCRADAPGGCAGRPGPRDVTLPTFQIHRNEVTASEYAQCVAAGACPRVNDRMNFEPAQLTERAQAEAYCRWVGARLPTEDEWEAAAREDTTRLFPWGDEYVESCDAVAVENPGECYGVQTVGTRSLDRTPRGVNDLAGNVRELVVVGADVAVKGGGVFAQTPDQMRLDARAPLAAPPLFVGFRCAR